MSVIGATMSFAADFDSAPPMMIERCNHILFGQGFAIVEFNSIGQFEGPHLCIGGGFPAFRQFRN
jgi:hypothetical protein